MQKSERWLAICFLSLGSLVAIPCASSAGSGVDARAAMERLRALAGRWEGTLGEDNGPSAVVEYRVVSNGSAVMEFMFPGTEHEMVSVYHLDGDELVMKHYCAMGNQPEVRLDRERSTEDALRFVFTGGTNLDPAKDTHIHEGSVFFREGGRLESEWTVFGNGKPAGANRFFLSRARE